MPLATALLQPGNVDRVGAFFAGFDAEPHPVAFLNFVDEARLVHENFFLVIVSDDEAEAFGVVEKLNGAGEHERAKKSRIERGPRGWYPGTAAMGVAKVK